MWYLYILQCRDDSFYTGITTNIPNRLERHNSGQGAKYTRTRRPCRLVYYEKCSSESGARQRECEIKGWSRNRKLDLIRGFSSESLGDILKTTIQ